LKRYGAVKIVPPAAWRPLTKSFDKVPINTVLEQTIYQKAEANEENVYYTISNLTMKSSTKTSGSFKQLCQQTNRRMPLDAQDAELYFWSTLSTIKPLYAADIDGTLFQSDKHEVFNLAKISRRSLLKHLKSEIPGITSPYLYCGMFGSVFGLQSDDGDLYSMNYLHYGMAQHWYVIAPQHTARLRQVITDKTVLETPHCQALYRHKSLIIPPRTLNGKYSIPFHRIVQRENELVVTYPTAFRQGFNSGYNVVEACNFALPNWLDYGRLAVPCNCELNASVIIDVKCFTEELIEAYEKDYLEGNPTATSLLLLDSTEGNTFVFSPCDDRVTRP
jgi:jumonji domain-containing protein 2